MSSFSCNSLQALAILAVDDIRPSKAGLKLLHAVDSGEMTIEEANEAIKVRAREYGATATMTIKPSHQIKKL